MNENQQQKYLTMNMPELIQEYFIACQQGNINNIKYLLTSSELKENVDVNVKNGYALVHCVINNQIEALKYILASPELKSHADINGDDNAALVWACSFNKIEMIKYLLNSPDLPKHVNINAKNDFLLKEFCIKDNLDFVKYLLTSTELNKHAKIKSSEYRALIEAYTNKKWKIVRYLLTSSDLKENVDIDGYNKLLIEAMKYKDLKTIKYLLTSPELKIHAEPHHNNDEFFDMAIGEFALKYSAPLKEKKISDAEEIINYLIFDYNINYTEKIQSFLNIEDKNTKSHMIKELNVAKIYLKNLFDKRELNTNLNNNLNFKEPSQIKYKI